MAESSLKDRLHTDMVAAMKARDDVTKATLRMVLAAIGEEEVAGKSARRLSDDEVMAVLRREAKKRNEAAAAYDEAGRAAQAAQERGEGEVVARYLPVQLDDAELAAIIKHAVTESGATGMPQMGVAMRSAQQAVAGRADGARVAAEVRRVLTAG